MIVNIDYVLVVGTVAESRANVRTAVVPSAAKSVKVVPTKVHLPKP